MRPVEIKPVMKVRSALDMKKQGGLKILGSKKWIKYLKDLRYVDNKFTEKLFDSELYQFLQFKIAVMPNQVKRACGISWQLSIDLATDALVEIWGEYVEENPNVNHEAKCRTLEISMYYSTMEEGKKYTLKEKRQIKNFVSLMNSKLMEEFRKNKKI